MSSHYIQPDAQAVLDASNKTPLGEIEKLTVDQARAFMAQMRAAASPIPHDLAYVQDLQFDDLGHPLRVRVYDKQSDRATGPVIVYFHGGGFVFGDLESHHALCLAIARQMDIPLVSVNYRLAPEHPFPAAPEDAEGAVRWISDHAKARIGRDATAIILAGDSAGANIAAVTARALRDSPARLPVIAQMLMYPCTAVESLTVSKTEFANGFFLTVGGMKWFFDLYAPQSGDVRIDLHAFDQHGMPPTVLVTAGLDPLRDEGRAYASALVQAGVPTIYQEAVGNIHGCFSMCAAIPSAAKDLSRALSALRLIIGEAERADPVCRR
jgi:acetyl esterase